MAAVTLLSTFSFFSCRVFAAIGVCSRWLQHQLAQSQPAPFKKLIAAIKRSISEFYNNVHHVQYGTLIRFANTDETDFHGF